MKIKIVVSVLVLLIRVLVSKYVEFPWFKYSPKYW